MRNTEIQLLEDTFGIVLGNSNVPWEDGQQHAFDMMPSDIGQQARRFILGMDAAPPNALQTQLVTAGNAGIPAYLANFMDPKMVRVLTSPPKAAIVLGGEQKKGDWTTATTTFPIVESTGEVSSYGDHNNNGRVGVNANFEPRQSYTYQAFTEWGDLELDRAGLAKIDWAAEVNIACALKFAKFQNYTYLFGVSGLDNFGLMNDPSLNAALTPATKTSNSNTTWVGATGVEIFADVQALFAQLQKQLKGNIDLESPMTLVISSLRQSSLTTPMQNVYGTPSVKAMITETFPNLKIQTMVEYSTASGELAQLIAKEVNGQEVAYPAFTEKMRAHAIVRETSSTHQKKSAGTWGTIIKIPAGISQMLGI